MKPANREHQPSAWGVLLLPLCCLLPLVLISLVSWIATTSFELSAPLLIGGAVVVAGLILWGIRRHRRADRHAAQNEPDKCGQ
jgi:hypothetical protein